MVDKSFPNSPQSILTDIFDSNIKLLDQLEITHCTDRYSYNSEDKSHKIEHELFLIAAIKYSSAE